jgi:hypothetical protein
MTNVRRSAISARVTGAPRPGPRFAKLALNSLMIVSKSSGRVGNGVS